MKVKDKKKNGVTRINTIIFIPQDDVKPRKFKFDKQEKAIV